MVKRWSIKANENKSTHVTFTLKRENCPKVALNGNQIPQGKTVKYLGISLDRRLTWRTHIFAKTKQLGLKFQQMYSNFLCDFDRASSLTFWNRNFTFKF